MVSFTSTSISLLLLSLTSLASARTQPKRQDAYPDYPCGSKAKGELCTLDGKKDFDLSSIYDTFNFTARGEIGQSQAVKYLTLAFQKANTTDIYYVGSIDTHWRSDFGVFEGLDVKIPCGAQGGSHYLNIVTNSFSGVAEIPSVGVKTFGPFNVTASC